PDRATVAELVGGTLDAPPGEPPAAPHDAPGGPPTSAAALAAAYAEVLGRDHVGPTDSFVGLGGDSLSYVEASVRVEAVLGHLPAGWHTMAVADLDALGTRRPRRLVRPMETGVVLRGTAI